MPTIPQYYSQSEPITPSAVGGSSFEQAGRRIGPLYNEAATFRGREGRLAAEAEKQKLWPFDILRLYQIRATEQAKLAAQATSANASGFRVIDKPGASGNASDFDVPQRLNDGWTPGFNDLGQVSRGAAAIGNAVSDGGYGLAKAPKGGGAPPPDASGGGAGSDYMLYQGQFVSSAYGNKLDAEERASEAQRLKTYGTDLSEYYQQYYGYKPVPAQNQDPSQGTPGNPVPNMTGPGYVEPNYGLPDSTRGYGGYSSPTYGESTGGFFGLPASNGGSTPDQGTY